MISHIGILYMTTLCKNIMNKFKNSTEVKMVYHQIKLIRSGKK